MWGTGERVVSGVILALFVAAPLGAAGPDLRLVDAAKRQDLAAVRALLTQGVDVNTAQPDGATALHWAAYWNDEDAIDLLLRAGAAVNAKNEPGATPLWLAAAEGRARLVERLLEAGADPNAALLLGETPLMSASRAGSVAAVEALLTRGADVNARERSRGQTALMWAVAETHPDVVQMLIDHHADVHARSSLRRLVRNTGDDGGHLGNERQGTRDLETGRALELKGLVEEDSGGFTALLFAARVGDVASARLLLEAGANVDETAPTGASALAIAVFSGQPALVEFLLERGADPNAAGAGYAPLHAAILRGDLQSVNALLARGADPNAPLRKGTAYGRGSNDWSLSALWIGATPIWLAARLSDAEFVRTLAAAGADPRFVRDDGTTILTAPLAAIAERFRPIGARDPREEARATEGATLDVLKAALELGADINTADREGNTALHAAASRRLNSVVQCLAEHGANLDVRNKKDETPLALASQERRGQQAAAGGDPAASEELTTADLLRKLGAKEETNETKPR